MISLLDHFQLRLSFGLQLAIQYFILQIKAKLTIIKVHPLISQ